MKSVISTEYQTITSVALSVWDKEKSSRYSRRVTAEYGPYYQILNSRVNPQNHVICWMICWNLLRAEEFDDYVHCDKDEKMSVKCSVATTHRADYLIRRLRPSVREIWILSSPWSLMGVLSLCVVKIPHWKMKIFQFCFLHSTL